jgi:tol-pal system protein YbgF
VADVRSLIKLIKGWGAVAAACGAVVAIAAAGCAGVSKKTTTESRELRRQVDSLRRQLEHDSRTIHDLENRALVCEDKLDTAQVAIGRTDSAPPRLPVQRKRRVPDDKPIAAAPRDDAPIPTGDPEPSWDDEVEIVYEGEAAKDDQPRRVIRIHDSSAPVVIDDDTDEPRARAAVIPPREAPPVAPARVTPAAPDAMSLYKSSYAALGRGDHVTAVAGFKTFLDKWPDHDYADNSQYWLGEAWYDMGDFKTALAEFRKVVQRYPLGNKAPDAMLKVGYCYAKLSDLDAARDVLAQVVEIHPASDAARLAARRLEELKK